MTSVEQQAAAGHEDRDARTDPPDKAGGDSGDDGSGVSGASGHEQHAEETVAAEPAEQHGHQEGEPGASAEPHRPNSKQSADMNQ